MLEFGVCGGLEQASAAANAGYSFLEGSVRGLLKPELPEETFLEELSGWRAAALPCPVLNCLLPRTTKIVGPQVDLELLEVYLATVMARAQTAGVDTIVFGSGAARAIPEGFDRDAAQAQLHAFCRMAATKAAAHDVCLVVEPLQQRECNVLTTVGEALQLVRAVDHPALRLLVDAYHWLCDRDSVDDLVAAGPWLRHAHIATAENRRAPGVEPCDFSSFFNALRSAGYQGRLSIEGRIVDPEQELPAARAIMMTLAGSDLC